jgi:hypothetical protein
MTPSQNFAACSRGIRTCRSTARRSSASWAGPDSAAAYTAAALLASLYDVENVLFRFGWNPAPGQWNLTALPNALLPALVLLATGAGAYAVQRRPRTAT